MSSASPKPLWSRYEEELSVLRSKSRMKEDLIISLNSDKIQLEKEVAGLMEQLNKAKRVKPGKQSVQ